MDDSSGIRSEEISNELIFPDGYNFNYNEVDKITNFNKKVLYSATSLADEGEKRLILSSKEEPEGVAILGSYDIAEKPIVDAVETTGFTPRIYFIADGKNGEENVIFSAPINSISDVTAEPILTLGALEIEENFGSIYIIAPNQLDPSVDSIYLIDQNENLSVLYTSSSEKSLRNLTKSGDYLLLQENSSSTETFDLLKLDPFDNTVTHIREDFGGFSLSYGIKENKGILYLKPYLNHEKTLILSSNYFEDDILATSIYEPTISENSVIAIEEVDSGYKLSSFYLEQTETSTLKIKSTSSRNILYAKGSKKQPPFIVKGDEVFYISINQDGNKVLSKSSIRSLETTHDLSLTGEQVTEAGLAFAGNKIFYISESNKIISYSIETSSNKLEAEINLGPSSFSISSGLGVGINNDNWFFYGQNGAYLAGIIPTNEDNKHQAVYIIDTSGNIKQLFNQENSPIGFLNINFVF
jgi:hypothetical protein